MPAPARTLPWVLLALEEYYGRPPEPISTDPFALILWEQVAYLAREPTRRAAFERLRQEVGLTPASIRRAPVATLRRIARLGGAIAAPLRAERMRRSAEIVKTQWNDELREALSLPLAKARQALTAFPMIGPPAADRILAITGAHPVLALDSNALRVLLRLGWGTALRNYAATYRSAQEAIGPHIPTRASDLSMAADLLRQHGSTLCRRTTPRCKQCPLAPRCSYQLGLNSVG